MVTQMQTQEMIDFNLTEMFLFEQSGDGDDGVLRIKRKRGRSWRGRPDRESVRR